jgi:hypothetical protein
MEDNEDDDWGPDYVSNEHKAWIDKVEDALLVVDSSNLVN